MLYVIVLVIFAVDAFLLGLAILAKGKIPFYDYYLPKIWGVVLIMLGILLALSAFHRLGIIEI